MGSDMVVALDLSHVNQRAHRRRKLAGIVNGLSSDVDLDSISSLLHQLIENRRDDLVLTCVVLMKEYQLRALGDLKGELRFVMPEVPLCLAAEDSQRPQTSQALWRLL